MESRRESGGKPVKSPKIGFGDFRMEGGAKKTPKAFVFFGSFEQILGSAAPTALDACKNGTRNTRFCNTREHTPIDAGDFPTVRAKIIMGD